MNIILRLKELGIYWPGRTIAIHLSKRKKNGFEVYSFAGNYLSIRMTAQHPYKIRFISINKNAI